MRTGREEFLRILESVAPGLAPRDTTEQSSCFVLDGGWVITYNDEVAVRARSGLPKAWQAAVPAKPLLSILPKIPDEEVTVDLVDRELRITGKRRETGIRTESEITMPLDKLEEAGDWRDLPAEFLEALNIVQGCAGKNKEEFALTCVHVAPRYVEACDNYQAARYKLKTGFASSALFRKAAVRSLGSLGVNEVSEGRTWVHFRNPQGLVISCRRYAESYKDLAPMLEVEGHPATLPKGLAEAALNAAQLAEADAVDSSQVLVEIRPGKLRVIGQGAFGWHRERLKLPGYDGAEMDFLIAPDLLAEITKKHNDCVLSERRLKVEGGRWAYVTCLSRPGAAVEEEEEYAPAAAEGGEEAYPED
jgi:hypothetical protein